MCGAPGAVPGWVKQDPGSLALSIVPYKRQVEAVVVLLEAGSSHSGRANSFLF